MQWCYKLLVWICTVHFAVAVKRELFKSCDNAGFCHRNRHYAKQILTTPEFQSPYSIDSSTVHYFKEDSSVCGNVVKALPNGKSFVLPFNIEILEGDNLRLRVLEAERHKPTTHSVNNKRLETRRYDEAWRSAFKEKPKVSQDIADFAKSDDSFSIKYGKQQEYEARVYLKNFKVEIYFLNNLEIVLNERSFFNLEHWRYKDEQADNMLPQESDYDAFSDSFKDASSDKLPFGPESIGIDATFVNYGSVYGIPEHADTFELKDTMADDPYRLFNVDIFEYETQSKFPMYGSIPLMVALKPTVSAGLFWVNSADTYVDIYRESQAHSKGDQTVMESTSTKTHWFSEAGIVDLVIMLDKTPKGINKKYGELSGNPELPQLFTLGYHQCRWNYNDVDDILDVTEKFDASEIPYDAIWLDIEYTENKKYFTWKKGLFDDHIAMNKKLAETGRNLVAIIDPHLKTAYDVSDAVVKNDWGIKNSDNDETYKGHCWPGESVWIDTFSPKACQYWEGLFQNNTQFSGDETNLHIWNDMSEPSVFSGVETTAPKDIIHYGGWEHRSVHNAYGLTFHEATYDALKKRYGDKRPFILTRAYYAGSQRTAAMWSGDNRSKWEFLQISLPMALTSQVVGMPFTGSDVGGFFGDPSEELLTRWYQAGIWYPFFRGHAHIDSKRREPYIAGEPYTPIMRDAIRLRYALLPVFYTAFHQASVDNSPILVPMVYANPENPEVYSMEDQFFVANSGILVKPVTSEGSDSVSIYIPDNKPYFNFKDYSLIQGQGYHDIAANLSTIPIVLQGGHIFARKDRYRRSSKLMKYDPYTLVVVLEDDKASGSLYIDDGETFYYKDGDFITVDFTYYAGILESNVSDNEPTKFIKLLDKVKVEKVIIVGQNIAGSNAKVTQSSSWSAEVETLDENAIMIRNPAVAINKNWKIELQ